MIKLNRFITLLIVLVIINCNYQIVKADAESKALDVINRYRDIGRYTFFTTDGHLESYPPGFCGGTPIDECKWDEYIEAVILLSAIALVVGLITLVFGIIFWLFRCICFGGFRPTHGFFCPKTKYDPDIGEGYSGGKVLILKIVTLVMVAGCVAVFITALKGNSSTSSGINNLSDTIFNKTSSTLDELTLISQELNQTKYEQFGGGTQQIQNQLNEIISYGEDLESKGETISSNAKDVNAIRTKIIVIGLVFCVINAGTIGVAALCGLPKMARSAAMSLVLLIPFMWIVFSVHYPINSVVADVCMTYNNSATHGVEQLANFTNPIISQIFGTCQDSNNFNSSALLNLETTVNGLIQNATTTICDNVNDACQQTFPRYPNDDPTQTPFNQNVLDCSPNVTCGNSTFNVFVYNSTVHDFNYKCKNSQTCGDTSTCDPTVPTNIMTCGWVNVTSVNQCSLGGCIYNSQLINSAKEIVKVSDSLTSLLYIWTEQFLPLFRCSSLLSFIDEVQNIVCIDEVNSLDLIVAPTAIFAILLTGLGITGVLGSKRFNSHYKIKK
ncbi:hypothetical protein RB653_004547 [Dictyostelium firmibasis]|uniref:Transmembrane protein n=1 Tax=Dictyostelium firmibasis TaxID=79012 RepID=A0AAN7U6G5_9MYCE